MLDAPNAPKGLVAKKPGPNDALTEAPDVPQRKEPEAPLAKIKLDGVRQASMSKPTQGQGQAQSDSQKLAQRKQATSNTSITSTRYNNSKKRKNEWMSLLTQMSIIFVLAGGTYYYYKNYYLKSGPPIPGISDPGEIEMPSLPKYRVSVSSSPGGANIMVDGVYSGYRTPSVILVPAGKKTVIKLEHEDFFDREVEKVFTATDSIAFNLERKPQPGYINIYVSNGGPNTILFLNGRRINERPPLKKYPVTANSEIVIKAENPITQLTDTQKIIVLPNKTVDLEMILGRKPAGTK